MKIRNLVLATAGAASLALVLSACSEPAANNSANNKPSTPASTPMPVNTATPANLTPANGGNANTKPINGGNTNHNANANAKKTP